MMARTSAVAALRDGQVPSRPRHPERKRAAMPATGPILNTRETAQYLTLSESAVRSLIASGDLPHRRIGPGRGRIVTTAEDREAYLDAHRAGEAAYVAAPGPTAEGTLPAPKDTTKETP